MRLHFSIGCYDCRGTSRCRHGFQLSGVQILFADHVQKRSGVYHKFSFLWFKSWWRRQTPIFRRWEDCCFIFLFNLSIFSASIHAASRAHRSCHSVSSWDRSSNFGALGLRQITPSDGFWSRRLAWRNTALVDWTHRIGFNVFELFRKIDEDSATPYLEIRNPSVVYSMNCTQQVRGRARDVSRQTTGFSVLSCNSYFFSIATALLSPFFLDLFARLFFNLSMRIRALLPNVHPFSDL